MLANLLKKVFTETDSTPDSSKIAFAAIGLVIEVVHADHNCTEEELRQLRAIASDTFAVDAARLDDVIANALDDHDRRVSIQPLTRLINDTFSPQQKADLVKAMWQIAFADGNLEKYEEGTIRKIADLLYVPHSVFIKMKLLAEEEK